jgi:hypothetical protein
MELDCDDDPGELDTATARQILELHRHLGWQPCLCRLAALAYLSETDHEL